MPRILVVEDDITFQPIWAYIIDRVHGKANLDWVSSVAEAEEKMLSLMASGSAYDLIVSDIFLLGSETGIDLWTKYHQQFHESIVLVSTSDPMQITLQFKGKGSPSYLQKPLNVHEAIEMVYTLLQRRIA
jgi:response regulator of citrate/malate metabolism